MFHASFILCFCVPWTVQSQPAMYVLIIPLSLLARASR